MLCQMLVLDISGKQQVLMCLGSVSLRTLMGDHDVIEDVEV